MNKTRLIDVPSPSLVTVSNSADGELNEDDIFAIEVSQAPPRNSPVSSPVQHHHHHPSRQLQRSKSNLKNVETSSGILAVLPESPGNNSYLSHVFHHKPAATLSTSVSSTASSLSSPGGGGASAARIVPSAPKPSQERLSYIGGGKYPQSAPVQVPIMSSKMMNRHKKEFKLTDVVDEEEEDEEEEMVPPHEIVARSLAQSSMLSCSVLEGAGRTLKGRDLRQVNSETLNRIKPVESSSSSSKLPVEVAVIRIQKAFRAFKARKRVCCLMSARRFNSLIQGHTLKNQTSTALNVMHSWCDIQSQIRERRLYMVTQGRRQQKRLENRLKLEIKLHELEVEWCGGSDTMEEILAKIQQREEATVKRERAMAYAFSHQWRANATQYLGQASFELGKESWGWSWKERWIAARPWEIRAQCNVSKPIKPVKKPEKLLPAKPDLPKAKEVANSKKLGSG